MKGDFTEARGEFFYGHVRGLSMWPALVPGDILRAVRTGAEAAEPGDLVVVDSPSGGRPVVHRLLRKRETTDRVELHTAGDRGGPDQPLIMDRKDEFLVVSGLLRRGRWRKPPGKYPPWVSGLPGTVVRLHCALVRRLLW